MTLLEAKDIEKSFGQTRVLRGVSVALHPGRITTIMGASGAGKTTLLQILGTLMRPDSGRLLWDGEDLTALSDRELSALRAREIGFIFQFHQLLPEFTALENVMLPALIAGRGRRDAEKKAGSLLDMLGLGHRTAHKPAALSGGERQRVAVARALVSDPGIVLADEPTGSLDSRNRDEILSLFQDLRERLGQGFLIVTHDPGLAEIADTRLTMRDGLMI